LRLQRNGALDRGRVTWWIGITSTALSMLGILDHFIGFLVLLGVAIPPVAGIMIVDYYLLRRDRAELLQARATGQLPVESERFNPMALLAWLLACASALLLPNIGIPALNSLAIGSLAYWVGMRLVAWRRGGSVARFASESGG